MSGYCGRKERACMTNNAFAARMNGLQASAIREILKFTADPSVISFAAGNPAPEAFPVDEVKRITASIMRSRSPRCSTA